MNKRKAVLTCTIIVLIILLIMAGCFYIVFNTGFKFNNGIYEEPTPSGYEGSDTMENVPTDKLVISTTGNDQIIKTDSNSTIRVINEYDSDMFKGKKTIMFMFASWCPNCAEELDDLDEILDYYKSSEYNVVFIAHEYESSIEGLINLLENDVTYDTEILLDLGRIIRKTIEPEASTIPRTYFLNENLTVLGKLDHATTLQEIQELANTYFVK